MSQSLSSGPALLATVVVQLCVLPGLARAQATLVKDIRPGVEQVSPHPTEVAAFQGRLYYGADHPRTGTELWTSDGTVPGTRLVRDALPGSSSLDPRDLVPVGSTQFFQGNVSLSDYGLWKTDGTAGGTAFVAAPGGFLLELTNVAGTLFFTAQDGAYGRDLWKSDGTSAGTVRVKDINPGNEHSGPHGLTAVGATLFFLVESPGLPELWRSDGTAAGTVKVAEIADTIEPAYLTAVNGSLFFVSEDEDHGRELWKTDGITTQVIDILPGRAGSRPYGLVDFNGVLFFTIDGGGLWRSDGTPSGTFRVKDMWLLGQLTPMGGTLLFSAITFDEGFELWKSDGTEAGTVLVKDVVPGPASSAPMFLTNVNGVLYFLSAATGELWKSDGTAAGTLLVIDLLPGPELPHVRDFTAAGGYLFFVSTTETGPEAVWRSDGTAAGTIELTRSQGPVSSDPDDLLALGTTLIFTADDGTVEREPWASDGSAPGTLLLRDIRPTESSVPANQAAMGGRVFFSARDASAYGLWSTDGTATGTTRVGDAAPFAGMIAAGSTLYFDAFDDSHGDELWKSDGTGFGAFLVKDIVPGGGSSSPLRLVNANGTVFFTATTPGLGTELWTSNGTAAGTVLARDIRPGDLPSNPVLLIAVGNQVFFSADDGVHGRELWKSDGTFAGTVLVKDILPGPDSALEYYERFAVIGSTVFFVARDGVHGTELWRSDGTSAGTLLIKDISPSVGDFPPAWLTPVGSVLFFSADDGTSGRELWKSDGTSGGTVLVKDLIPGPGGSDPRRLADAGGVLYFSASDLNLGTELWKSDGSAAGTVVAADVATGPAPSDPSLPIKVGAQLFFAASDDTVGRELWRVPLGRSLAVGDVPIAEGTGGSSSAVFVVTLSSPSASIVTVSYATVSGTATSPADFTASSGTLAFAPGVTSQTVTVPLVPDSLDETDEAFLLVLSSPSGAVLADSQAEALIRDDDGPAISIADVALTEGSVGPVAALLTVTLSAASLQAVSLDYATTGGSASPADYVATSGRLDFRPGMTALTVTVPVVADRLDEFDETFVVNLSNPQNATLADGQATVTIVDDDAPPVLSLSDVTLLEGNQGTRTATLMASLSAPSGKTIGVQFTTRDGTASAGSDYAAAAGSLSFAPGATSRPVAVTVNGDTTVEPDETFFVDLSNPVEVTLGDATGSATVLDDDLGRGFHPVAPCRLVDTRQPAGPSGGPALAANSSRSFPVAGVCNVPPAARAVVVNVVAVNPGAAGNLRLHPAGSATPNASVLNFRAGRTRAGNGIATLGAGGEIAVRCDMPPGSTAASHLVLDVYGYFE